MSLLGWLFPTTKINQRAPGLVTARGAAARNTQNHPPAADHEAARLQRRQLLYGIVREAMARAGVLAADYTFKVLMLDTRGERFIVMLDVAKDYSDDVGLWSDTEAWITRSAQLRLGIEIKSVYWRVNPKLHASAAHSSHSRPGDLSNSASARLISRPMPLSSGRAPLTSAPAPLLPKAEPVASKVTALPHPVERADFDPIDAQEMAAFRQALAKARARSNQARASRRPRNASGEDDSGFADTVVPDMPQPEQQRPDALSSTQYGEPR